MKAVEDSGKIWISTPNLVHRPIILCLAPCLPPQVPLPLPSCLPPNFSFSPITKHCLSRLGSLLPACFLLKPILFPHDSRLPSPWAPLIRTATIFKFSYWSNSIRYPLPPIKVLCPNSLYCLEDDQYSHIGQQSQRGDVL